MTPILQKLSLLAYRGMSDVVLDGLGSVNLVVGANNSGKSSVLEGAGLILRPLDPSQWVGVVRQRDASADVLSELSSMFPDAAQPVVDQPLYRDPIRLEGVVSGTPRRIHATCSVPSLVDHLVVDGDVAASRRVDVQVNDDPSIVLKFPVLSPTQHRLPMFRVFSVNPASHYSTEALVDDLSQAVIDGKKELAVELLQVLDPDVVDIDAVLIRQRRTLCITHKKRGVVEFSSFGDGMRRAAALALALARASQGVLLVDEIEAGFHTRVLETVVARLLDAAVLAQVQVIATTHSLEAVDAVLSYFEKNGAKEGLAGYWIQRGAAGHEVRRYTFERLLRMREGGMDIR